MILAWWSEQDGMTRKRCIFFAVTCAGLGLTSAAGADELRGLRAAPFSVERTGTLSRPELREISGMAVSRRQEDVIWVHNDSGSRPLIYAISPDGVVRMRATVDGATSRDWEDMAAFDYEGRPMLVVADTGDNNARRDTVWLHFFEEPEIGSVGETVVSVEWSVPFRFPEGPADCESVAVDVASDQVLLLTKRENPPRLYAVPIRPPGAGPSRGRRIDAELIAPLTTIPRPRAEDLLADAMFGAYSSQPTAMDVFGNQLMILTYRHAYIYQRTDGEPWTEVIARPPFIVILPRMKQGESLAYDAQGRDAFVTSEKRGAPIYRLRRVVDQGDGVPIPGLK